MGNEIATVAGGVATAGCAIATAATLGKVDAVKNATVNCARYTGEKFMDSNVRYVGQLTGEATAVAAVSVAAGVCLGQVDGLNKTVTKLADHCGETGKQTGKTLLHTGNDLADGIPGVAHMKGGIHYICGDKEGGDKAMKSGSRTVGVIGGGAAGFLVAGPVGAVAGGIAGGAAIDAITTGVESAIEKKYCPNGQIASWTKVAQARSPEEVTEGVISGLTSVALDGVGGYAAGKIVNKAQTARLYRVMDQAEVDSAAQTGKVSHAYNQNTPKGETCFSESSRHSSTYVEQRGASRGGVPQATAQINLDKAAYARLKEHSIPQRGSGAINDARLAGGKPPYNITTTEKLAGHPQGKVNMNVKGPINLEHLNQGIKKVKPLDPHSVGRSGPSKFAHRHGKSGTIEGVVNGNSHAEPNQQRNQL